MDRLESDLLNVFKLPLKVRNQAVDAVFYNIGALSVPEMASLSPWVDRKGAIIVVSPGDAQREDRIRHYPNALRFMLKEGDNVQAIAVASVGSSVLGTAALARAVADFYGFDVAGIVSGYGVADVVQEGLGGWFFYGAIDRFRYKMEQALARLETSGHDGPNAQSYTEMIRKYLISPLDSIVPGNLDLTALHDLLYSRFLFRQPKKLRMLVGHSRGNLLIRFILNHMVAELRGEHGEMPREPFNNLAVVTLGAVVDIPPELIRAEHDHQFLGELDLLGMTNSDQTCGVIEHSTRIPGAGHHLNPTIPFSMSVPKVLEKVTLPDLPPDRDGVHLLTSRPGDWTRATRGRLAATSGHGL
jgi:hypothetical protein